MTDDNTGLTAPLGGEMHMVVGVSAPGGQETVTARKAGGLTDMRLPVSPREVALKVALQNLAKAINLALQSDFLETDLEKVYKAARVRKGTVQILHQDYIGLGDGIFAKFGKTLKSFQLTFRGPDPASPEGKALFAAEGRHAFRGMLNFVGRKLNFLQEFEDKVPILVEQMLDRLEAARMIQGWSREDWRITTSVIGLDVTLRPAEPEPVAATDPPA